MGRINVARGLLSILGSNVASLFISVVTTPILVRLLGSEGYGEFAFVIAVYGIVNMVAAPGISTGVRKYVAEERDRPGWEGHVFGFYFRVGLAMVGSIVALIWLGVHIGLLERFVPAYFAEYFYVLMAWVVVAQLFSLGKNTLRGFGLEHYSDPLLVVKNGLFAAVGLSLVYLGWGVTGALLGKVVAVGTIAAIMYALVGRQLSLRNVVRRTPADFPRRDLLTFNFLNIVLLFLVTSLYNVDIVFLQVLAGSQATGYYRAALTIAEFLWFVPFAVQTALLHSTSELWSRDEREQITELASLATRYSLLFTALLAIGLVALADVFLPLYFGPEFSRAVTPLLFLLPGALGFAVARPIFAIGQGNGDLRNLIYATGVAAGINVVLNLLLIPRYGMYGAAVATSAGYGSMLVMHVWSARTLGFYPTSDLRLGRVVATVLVTAPVLVALANAIPHDLLALAVVPPTGLAVYVAAAFKTGAVDAEEFREFVGALPEPVGSTLERLGRIAGGPA